MAKEKVIVLGAGVQGVCAALALHQQGYDVTLVDQAPDCMLRTSLVNEGRIHLGLLYAGDDSFRTSRLMLQAALQFAPLLEDWIGSSIDWTAIKSNPITYVIVPNSIDSPQHMLAHYEQLERIYQESFRKADIHYLGETPANLWQETPVPAGLNPDFAAAIVATPEVSIDRTKFRQIMRRAIRAAGSIETLYQCRVESVTRTAGGFRIEGTTPEKKLWQREFGLVVNCLWESRLKIDQQLGLTPERHWVYRLKYRVSGQLPDRLSGLASFSFVQGPSGTSLPIHKAAAFIFPGILPAYKAGVLTS